MSRRIGRFGLVAAAALLALSGLPPAAAQAQTFRGRILDQRDERPLHQAIVRLLDRDGEVEAIAVSDPAGNYTVEVPSAGEYSLSAEHLGYETTRSPLFAVQDPAGVYPVDLSLQRAPLGLEGFTVTAERFEEFDQRLRLLIGVSTDALRVPPLMRPSIEEHIAQGHDLEDVLRWSNIPGMTVRQARAGPCFLFRVGGRMRIPESCVTVYLNDVPLRIEATNGFPLDLIESMVIVRPTESIAYPSGAILLYSRAWIGP